VIKIKNLTKKYKNQIVLDVQNFSIFDGEFIAIIGESGSGKSTFLNLLSGLDSPITGEILVDGFNIMRYSDSKMSKYRRDKIGFVFQFFYLQPFLTINNNIQAAAFPSRLKSKERIERAVLLAKMVGLEDKLNSYPKELSGGQIQRAAIARSLINSPEILFADEPTGNLDSENSQQIINLLLAIKNQTGMTLVVVTHNDEIAQKADRIVKLKDGKIVESVNQNVEN